MSAYSNISNLGWFCSRKTITMGVYVRLCRSSKSWSSSWLKKRLLINPWSSETPNPRSPTKVGCLEKAFAIDNLIRMVKMKRWAVLTITWRRSMNSLCLGCIEKCSAIRAGWALKRHNIRISRRTWLSGWLQWTLEYRRSKWTSLICPFGKRQ